MLGFGKLGSGIFFLVFCLLLGTAVSAEPVKIEGAEIEWHKYYDNVFINTSDYVIPSIEAQKCKLVLEFKDTQTAKFTTSLKKSPRIESIHSMSPRDGNARIVIELKKEVKFEMASIYGKGEVVIEIADKTRPSIYTGEGIRFGEEKVVEAPEPPIKIEVLPPIMAKDPVKGKVLKGKTIVIDPGHGGEDPGAFGWNGLREKDLTLLTSLQLSKQLRSRGASVILTRKSDIKNSLRSIVEMVGKVGADIYIGMHYNSIDGMSISGTETYYYTPQSFRLAHLIHKSMVLTLGRQDRGIKRAMFYTIHHTDVPSVLVEPVYITDRKEGLLASSPAFQNEIAKSIADGIVHYFTR